MKKKAVVNVPVIVLLFLSLIVVLIIIIFLVSQRGIEGKNENNNINTENNNAQSIEDVEPKEPIDCEKNFDCFIRAAENCELAKVRYGTKINIFGVESSSESLYEVEGKEEEKCFYYQRIESVDVSFSDELKAQMLGNGTSQEEMEIQEKVANESVQQFIGQEKICRFKKEDLIILLKNWKKEIFSTEDFKAAECLDE